MVYHSIVAAKPTEMNNFNKGYSIEVQTAWGGSSTYTFQVKSVLNRTPVTVLHLSIFDAAFDAAKVVGCRISMKRQEVKRYRVASGLRVSSRQQLVVLFPASPHSAFASIVLPGQYS